MGIFSGQASGLEGEIEKATSERNTTEQWSVIMDICDKITYASSASVKESLKIVVKRLNHQDPHVVMQAITLLDACVNNCGKNFHLEIASREFETEFKKLVSKSQPQIATKLKMCLKKWAEGDFKSDPQLNLIPALYAKMKQDGVDFSEPQTTVKREVQYSKDPNVVSSQQEAEDIAKAIELSLKEKGSSPKAQTFSSTTSKANTTSLYPSVSSVSNSTSAVVAAPSSSSATASTNEIRKVRALYDFEAAEDNELTFKAGEVIMVTEESDPNWWKGTNQRGEGYFPANFVTADLSMEPEDLAPKETKSNKKSVQFNNDAHEPKAEQAAEINEETIDRLLFLLHEADPADPSQDSDEMLRLENVVNQMGPLIDSELERVDRKHAQLTQLSSDLIDTINLYHSLMQTDTMVANAYGSGGFNQQPMYRPPGAIFSPNHSYGMNMNMPPMNSAMMSMPSMPGQHSFPPQMNNFQPGPNFPSGNFPQNSAGNFQMYQGMPPSQNQPPPQNSMPMSAPQPQQPQMGNMMHPVNGGVPQQSSMPHEHQHMYPGMYPPQQQASQQQQMAPQSIQSPVQQIPNTIGHQMMPGQQQVPHHNMQMPGGNMAI